MIPQRLGLMEAIQKLENMIVLRNENTNIL